MIIYYSINKDEESVKKEALKRASAFYNKNISEIQKTPKGKPILENLFISISHTKNILVIAFSEKNIGIDIEALDRKIKIKMTIKEWTEYESFCKWTGEGISTLSLYKPYPKDNIFNIVDISGYIISVCSEDRDYLIVKI